ncbi:hypothetical protein SS50377_27461 [Spironucleus salmonicida]|uniref:Uncharacterized protein n=1 Tax=Spironucleus salmonicida TaxID=348837 RepID=V6LR54_9EUKA|nr:hypothetical protein SS50377_27461 [Spironucleus salmonicida]|eukprot:EST43249.1 Hypothetical protein SS50377_16914 [Spironucleus salmonicida]
MQAALQMLLNGIPVPQKLFPESQVNIKDSLIQLDLDIVSIRYKGVKCFIIINIGQPIPSFIGKAFKLIRTMIYLQPELQKQDMLDQLKLVDVQDEFQDWDSIIKYFIDRDMLKYKSITDTIQYINSTSVGDKFFSDEDVELWLVELQLEDIKDSG